MAGLNEGCHFMVHESLVCKINCALHVIYQAFLKTADLGLEETEARITDALRTPHSTRPREPQSLRWSLPFIWIGLVYLSYSCSYSTVRSCVPVTVKPDHPALLQNEILN